MFLSKPSLDQLHLSVSMMVDGVIVIKFVAMLIQRSSLSIFLTSISIFLFIFILSTEDVVVPPVATMSKRGGHIVDCSSDGGLPAVTRNVLRPQYVWVWL